MSKTIWYPFPRHKPRSWLLGNGEVVTEPPLEQSGSGKKLRVVGTETSAFAKDMDTLILAAVQQTARAKNTYVWTPLSDRAEKMRAAGNVEVGENASDLYLLRPGSHASHKGVTRLWWTFQHSAYPAIEALLVVTAHAEGTGHAVDVKVVMPDTRVTNLMETKPCVEVDDGMTNGWYYQLNAPEDHEIRSFAVNNPPSWPQGILGVTRWASDRQVVQHLLRLVDQIDSLSSIQVPDMREWDDLKWMDLEVVGSNYNGAVRQSLTDYLAGTSGVERAVQIYDDLRDAMRSLGINLSPLASNDFHRALLENEESALRVEIGPAAGEEGPVHTLGVHLASGTFTVTCPVRHASPNEVADEWERLQTIASLQGELPALLAFAQEYGRTKDEKRARKVMRDRMKGARED